MCFDFETVSQFFPARWPPVHSILAIEQSWPSQISLAEVFLMLLLRTDRRDERPEINHSAGHHARRQSFLQRGRAADSQAGLMDWCARRALIVFPRS